MSEAFDALDKYFWLVQREPEREAPDDAFDWIFMMKDDNWTALDREWPSRPEGWRRECAYVLGEGPAGFCAPRLERAILDSNSSVALEAARSYASLVGENPSLGPPSAPLKERLMWLATTDADTHAALAGLLGGAQ